MSVGTGIPIMILRTGIIATKIFVTGIPTMHVGKCIPIMLVETAVPTK